MKRLRGLKLSKSENESKLISLSVLTLARLLVPLAGLNCFGLGHIDELGELASELSIIVESKLIRKLVKLKIKQKEL